MSNVDIESKHNKLFKLWSSLLESKGIKKEGLALLSGAKLVTEFCDLWPERVKTFVLGPKHQAPNESVKSFRLSSPLFQELDVIGTRQPLAVVEAPKLEVWNPESAPHGLELILALSDPSNLGAVLRSADAFGADSVILTKECASVYLPKALRAASLSTFRLKIKTGPSIKDIDTPQGVAIGLDMQGEPITHFEWPKDCYLVLGEEGQGLPEHWPQTRISIPMRAQVESLNAMAAASIALSQRYGLLSGSAPQHR